MEHTDRILRILEEQNVTSYKLAKATGISDSLLSKWRKNPSSKVSSGILVLIADYLNCSVDYLLGRTDDPKISN